MQQPAAIIRKALSDGRVDLRDLVEASGISRDHLRKMIAGQVSGSLEAWTKVCDALDRPGLMAHIIPYFTRTCIVCTSPYVDSVIRNEGSSRYRRTCSTRCGDTYANRMWQARNNQRSANRMTVVRRRLELYQRLTVAFCKSCEPLGVCRNDGCELRGVSPLPFIPMSAATKRAG